MTFRLSSKAIAAVLTFGTLTPALSYAMTFYDAAPEPGNLALLGLGLIGLGIVRRKVRERRLSEVD